MKEVDLMAGGSNAVFERLGVEARRKLEKQLAWLRPFEKAAVGRCPAEVRRRLLEVRPIVGDIAATLRSMPDPAMAGPGAEAAKSIACKESCANGRNCGFGGAAFHGRWAVSAKSKVSRRNAIRYARAFLARTGKLSHSADWDDLREARMLLLLAAGALETYLYGEIECFLPRFA